MDDKDNNEAPKEDATNIGNDNGDSIKVNVTDSSDVSESTEPKVEMPEASSEDSKETANEIVTEEEPMPIEEPKEEAPKEVIEETTIEKTVTEPESKPEDDTPGPIPSVQPTMSAAVSPPSEVAQLKKRNKSLKMWLVVFLLFLVALVAGGLVYFSQQSSSNDDLDAANAKNAELQQELLTQQQNSTQQTVDELNKMLEEEKTKNTELTATVAEQEESITAYQDTIKELQEVCGTACDSVDVPEPAAAE